MQRQVHTRRGGGIFPVQTGAAVFSLVGDPSVKSLISNARGVSIPKPGSHDGKFLNKCVIVFLLFN